MMRAIVTLLISVFAGACLPAAAADISAYQRGVLIQGSIEKGDYARIIAFVRHPDSYGRFARMVYLDSSGGDVVEAIKTAHLLDKSYAATHVSSGVTLGVHRIHVKAKEGSIDQQSAYVSQIARTVENYMSGLGTPRVIRDKMNATAPADLFVISPRWLAEQHLLAAVSYRLGFIDAAQAMKGKAPPVDDEADHWVAQIKIWITCADELRASNQRVMV